MGDEPDAAMDISNSPAYIALDALLAEGKLTQAVVDMYKSKYAQLHDYVIQTYDREKSMLQRAKVLNQELLGERIQLEKQAIHRHEELQSISNLEKEKEHALKELHDCEERDVILQYELSHLQMEEVENTRKLEQMHQENSDLVNPETEKVTNTITSLEEDLERTSTQYESEKKRREEISTHINEVRAQQISLEEEKAIKAAQLAKLQNDPERIRKQAAVVTKAVKNLETELERLGAKLVRYKAELVAQAAKRKEVDDVGKDLGRKLDLHRKTIEQREKEVDRIRKTLEYERQQHKQLLEKKVELELLLKSESEGLRHTMDELSRSNKEFDLLKRTIKKKQGIVDSALALQPGLETQKSDVEAELATYKAEGSLLKKSLKSLKNEVDVYIANFLRQEVVEKGKKTELEAQLKVIKDLELQITKWHAEEHRQRKTIQILTAQREIKAREAAKAQVRWLLVVDDNTCSFCFSLFFLFSTHFVVLFLTRCYFFCSFLFLFVPSSVPSSVSSTTTTTYHPLHTGFGKRNTRRIKSKKNYYS